MQYNIYKRELGIIEHGYEKRFSTGSADAFFAGIGIWYPSYLGVDIFFNDFPDSLLGLTNGKRILIKDMLSADVKDFVIMHEEEHVKDMSATEREIDKRALKRFFAKHRDITKQLIRLLEKRWGKENTSAMIRRLYKNNNFGNF